MRPDMNALRNPNGILGLPFRSCVAYNQRQNLPELSGPVPGGAAAAQAPHSSMPGSRDTQSGASTERTEAVEPSNGCETRAQKLQRIRREIEAGTYETPEKLEAAIGRMMGVLVDPAGP